MLLLAVRQLVDVHSMQVGLLTENVGGHLHLNYFHDYS